MNSSPFLKPKDLVVVLVVFDRSEGDWTYESLGETLHMSTSQVYYALERLDEARLYDAEPRLVHTRALFEFIAHGVRYAFSAHPGELTRGIPTAMSSSIGKKLLASSGNDPDYVWPTPKGETRGQRLAPLHENVPDMLMESDLPEVYEMLALIDIVRIGSAREREVAIDALDERLAP
jgi:hypothetical protein